MSKTDAPTSRAFAWCRLAPIVLCRLIAATSRFFVPCSSAGELICIYPAGGVVNCSMTSCTSMAVGGFLLMIRAAGRSVELKLPTSQHGPTPHRGIERDRPGGRSL